MVLCGSHDTAGQAGLAACPILHTKACSGFAAGETAKLDKNTKELEDEKINQTESNNQQRKCSSGKLSSKDSHILV